MTRPTIYQKPTWTTCRRVVNVLKEILQGIGQVFQTIMDVS
ncbi:MAG: hypothetical protein ABSF91_03815 [Bacteroidota bacterium]